MSVENGEAMMEIEHAQVEIGDDDRDLDEFIDREIEPRHLAVDPDETVILSGTHHGNHPNEGSRRGGRGALRWRGASVAQWKSDGLLIRGSQVRILPGAPILTRSLRARSVAGLAPVTGAA